jgi:methylated-DNA-[protein]-cysteine S-methyltransferase
MRELRALVRREAEEGSRHAVPAFRARAEAEGLVDVGYATLDSPFGPLLVAASRRGLVRLAYPNEASEQVLEELAAGVSPRVLESPAMLEEVRRELEEYFEGARQLFDISVDWVLTRGFNRKVLQATARIPYGSVSTYGDVAGRAGNPRAYRAAGNALGSNPIPIVVPCHRVVPSGGGLGGYTGGVERKEFLLSLEGAR